MVLTSLRAVVRCPRMPRGRPRNKQPAARRTSAVFFNVKNAPACRPLPEIALENGGYSPTNMLGILITHWDRSDPASRADSITEYGQKLKAARGNDPNSWFVRSNKAAKLAADPADGPRTGRESSTGGASGDDPVADSPEVAPGTDAPRMAG